MNQEDGFNPIGEAQVRQWYELHAMIISDNSINEIHTQLLTIEMKNTDRLIIDRGGRMQSFKQQVKRYIIWDMYIPSRGNINEKNFRSI